MTPAQKRDMLATLQAMSEEDRKALDEKWNKLNQKV